LVLNNIIKVITNFTIATAVTGSSISSGGACLAICYLNYSIMDDPVTLTTATVPPNSYNIHLEGLYTVVVINPLFTLQSQVGVTITGFINTNGT